MTNEILTERPVMTDEFFEKLKNENKVFKFKNKKPNSSLTEDYLFFLKKLNESNDAFKQVQVGEIVDGVITDINKKEIIIDIDFKDNVFVESKTIDSKMFESLNVGDNISVMISEIKDNPFFIKGSINDMLKLNVSNVAREHFFEDKFLYATVKESQPAGYYLDLEIDGQFVNAFMPNTLAGVNKLHDQASIVSQRIEVMLETLEQDKDMYVVSRKKYLESLIPERIKILKKEWFKDKYKVYTGFITGTTPFGVFVEFCDYLTGMIYRNNINEDWQSDEKWNSLKPGTLVEFYVKDIITKKNKIILTQILRESLWDNIKVDDVLRGKVIAIKPFGSLIKLDEETNGLIQITYLQKNKIVLNIGQDIDVKVTSIMKDERKINLSIIKD